MAVLSPASEHKTVQLELRHFYAQTRISELVAVENIHIEQVIHQSVGDLVLQLRACVAGERISEINYPSDWWQAFKQRWFPVWAQKRWPVKWDRYQIDLHYPHVPIAGGRPRIAVYSNKSPGFLHKEGE